MRALPDGYTLLMIDVSAAFNATLYDKLNFNFVRDIAPIANVVRVPNVIAVHPSFPAKTVPEFIAYAKANPGKISMATAGVGSSSHVFGELFKMTAGVDLVAVPYRGGGPALIDMLSGQVHVIFVPTPASIEYVRAGRLRALGVTSTTRVEILPDLPPVAEFVPGYEASSWYGICAPRNTPAEIIERLNKEINTALADPKIKAKLRRHGGRPATRIACRFCRPHRGRHREMGQGHPRCQYQAGVERSARRRLFHRSKLEVSTKVLLMSAPGHVRPSSAGVAYRPLPLSPKSGYSASARFMSTRP